MMHITFVKKIKEDGSPCRKCADVAERLEREGYMGRIDRTVIADERDPSSEGMRLGAEHAVDAAPFFIVTDGATTTVYSSYVKFVKEILSAKVSEVEEAKDLLASNEDLDFL